MCPAMPWGVYIRTITTYFSESFFYIFWIIRIHWNILIFGFFCFRNNELWSRLSIQENTKKNPRYDGDTDRNNRYWSNPPDWLDDKK